MINLPVKLICFKSVSSAMPFHDVGSYCCDYKNFPPVFIEFPVINKILTQDLDFWVVDDNIFLNYPLKQYFL